MEAGGAKWGPPPPALLPVTPWVPALKLTFSQTKANRPLLRGGPHLGARVAPICLLGHPSLHSGKAWVQPEFSATVPTPRLIHTAASNTPLQPHQTSAPSCSLVIQCWPSPGAGNVRLAISPAPSVSRKAASQSCRSRSLLHLTKPQPRPWALPGARRG